MTPIDPQLRALDIEIPAMPEVLVELSLLLAEDEVNLVDVARLIERDMALASAVLRAVNSSLYGLAGRVQSVRQAITYLGTREVTGITFELGLRAAFPPAAELEPIWQRAGQRGVLMGRLAQALGLDAWGAHSAGLFEECGKAVLYRHVAEDYLPMLRDSACDADLCQLELARFGVCHDALGAAMCETWGLGTGAVNSVRHRVTAQDMLTLPGPPVPRTLIALSVMAQAILGPVPAAVDDVVLEIAPQADLDATLALRAARRVAEQLAEARERGRA
jgi:HD-like signal output (HDOD) protein